jgi:hypothetical protein
MKCNLRTGAVNEVHVVRLSESKDNIKWCPLGEKANNNNDNLMIYDSEQVTRCTIMYVFPVTNSDGRECEKRSEEVIKNCDIFTMSMLGCYEEGNVGDTEPATDAHNSVADESNHHRSAT